MILGIPRLSDKASGGDTGQARLLGEGWTMAYQRAKQDDLSFIKSEREFLKVVLRIEKDSNSDIKDLKISNIDIKIPRDKSDNMLTKAQTLLDLLQAGVHPEIAFQVVGLFGDPHEVFEKSLNFQGEDFWKKVKDIAEEKIQETDINLDENLNDINNPASTELKTSNSKNVREGGTEKTQ